tara:strand:+ start:964 stop:1161 length:198 start_codon:yes stop_codon:yes gene_type:complete
MAKLTLDKETCIGCGACTAVAPELFEMDYDEGKAKVLKEELDEEDLQKAKDSIETCPVQCIKLEE